MANAEGGFIVLLLLFLFFNIFKHTRAYIFVTLHTHFILNTFSLFPLALRMNWGENCLKTVNVTHIYHTCFPPTNPLDVCVCAI